MSRVGWVLGLGGGQPRLGIGRRRPEVNAARRRRAPRFSGSDFYLVFVKFNRTAEIIGIRARTLYGAGNLVQHYTGVSSFLGS